MAENFNNFADKVGIISLLIGILFVALSLIMLKFPPKKINDFYGYRTSASMKNQDVWDFAQKYSTIKMFQLGIVSLAVSSLNSFINISQEQSVFLGMGVMILGCGAMFLLTEMAIKKNFPNQK